MASTFQVGDYIVESGREFPIYEVIKTSITGTSIWIRETDTDRVLSSSFSPSWFVHYSDKYLYREQEEKWI